MVKIEDIYGEYSLDTADIYELTSSIWGKEFAVYAWDAAMEYIRHCSGNLPEKMPTEVFFIVLDEKVIGITGYYPIEEPANTLHWKGNKSAGLRWHGILPEYRGNGYSKEALDLLIYKIYSKFDSIIEIADTEETKKYFLKYGFKEIHDEVRKNEVIEAGGDIGENFILEYQFPKHWWKSEK